MTVFLHRTVESENRNRHETRENALIRDGILNKNGVESIRDGRTPLFLHSYNKTSFRNDSKGKCPPSPERWGSYSDTQWKTNR